MATPRPIATERLLAFNRQVLDQALAVAQAHARPGAPPFDGPTGAHLRHVIEHYEALVHGLAAGGVDYDGRRRERALEISPALAAQRLAALGQQLAGWTPASLDLPLQVSGQGGVAGDFGFEVASSVGRELAFLASHAVHHYALLAAHLQTHGVELPAHFGKAPGTVAHEIATRAAAAAAAAASPTPLHFKELRCLALPLSA